MWPMLSGRDGEREREWELDWAMQLADGVWLACFRRGRGTDSQRGIAAVRVRVVQTEQTVQTVQADRRRGPASPGEEEVEWGRGRGRGAGSESELQVQELRAQGAQGTQRVGLGSVANFDAGDGERSLQPLFRGQMALMLLFGSCLLNSQIYYSHPDFDYRSLH